MGTGGFRQGVERLGLVAGEVVAAAQLQGIVMTVPGLVIAALLLVQQPDVVQDDDLADARSGLAVQLERLAVVVVGVLELSPAPVDDAEFGQ